MSCYTRHFRSLFEEAGLEDNRANRKIADKMAREMLGQPDAECPIVWKEVKVWMADNDKRTRLVQGLRASQLSE